MASNSKSTTLYSNNSKAYYLQAYFNEESTNTSQNSSRIYAEAKLTSTGYRWTSSSNSYLRIYWHDNRENYDRLVAETALTSITNNGSAYASGYIDPLYHNSDGGLSGYAYATFTKGGTSSYTPNTGGVTTDWTALTAIPRQASVTGATDFTDEGNPTITFNNPGGFRINARLEFAGTNIRRDNILNTGSYTFNLTEDERKLLRQKCTGNSIVVREVIATCTSGTTESLWSYQDKTMTIVNANPTFSNFNFEDTNSTTVALTGNNQNIINGYSNVKVSIPVANKAEALKEAQMRKYRFTCGDKSADDINYSNESEVNGTINGVPNGTFTVYATDSRNNSTSVQKLANQVINYNPLTKGNISIGRNNGVSESVTLSFNGTIDIRNFGEVTNSIKSAKLRFKVANSSNDWTEKDLTVSVSGSSFSFNGLVEGDTETKGFDVSNSYQIEVIVNDELSSVTFTAKFGSGTPNIALHKNGVGIMGKYDEEVGSKLQISGEPVLMPYVLYENTSGSTGTITLSDNVDNYKYVEIYCFSTSDGELGYPQSYVKTAYPSNGHTIYLTVASLNTGSWNIKMGYALLQDNQITRPYGHFEFNVSGKNTSTNYIGISKVIGYK